MVCRIRKVEKNKKIKWNGMSKMSRPNKWLVLILLLRRKVNSNLNSILYISVLRKYFGR